MDQLAVIAEAISTPEWRISPMHVAAQLLEDAAAQVVVPPRSAALKTLENPWEQLPLEQPFVLPEDHARVTAFNESAPENLRLHLDMLPEPFLGRRDAPVVLLNLNPGYTAAGTSIHKQPAFVARVRGNLCHLLTAYPFYLLDPDVYGPGRQWWESKLRHLLTAVGSQTVAAGVLNVEFFPYHSRRFKHRRLSLPSQRYGFSLVQQALARKAVVIILRGEKLWLRAVPELANYDYHAVKNWRKPAVSPRNCPDGFRQAVAVLRGEETPQSTVINPTLLRGDKMKNYTDPARSVSLLDELVTLGLDDSAFRALRELPMASIERHRNYCNSVDHFHEGGTNSIVQQRLEYVLNTCKNHGPTPDFHNLAREAMNQFPF